jgi:hypothetical protein
MKAHQMHIGRNPVFMRAISHSSYHLMRKNSCQFHFKAGNTVPKLGIVVTTQLKPISDLGLSIYFTSATTSSSFVILARLN